MSLFPGWIAALISLLGGCFLIKNFLQEFSRDPQVSNKKFSLHQISLLTILVSILVVSGWGVYPNTITPIWRTLYDLLAPLRGLRVLGRISTVISSISVTVLSLYFFDIITKKVNLNLL